MRRLGGWIKNYPMNRCPACDKMLYRTDDCKGGGIPCGRTDSGRKPSGGSSAVERRPSKPMVEGSTPSPRSKSRPEPAVDQQEPPPRPVAKSVKSSVASKTTKGKPRQSPSVGALSPDGPVEASAQKRRGRPAKGFDKAAYNREYMKKRRAEKAAKETK